MRLAGFMMRGLSVKAYVNLRLVGLSRSQWAGIVGFCALDVVWMMARVY